LISTNSNLIELESLRKEYKPMRKQTKPPKMLDTQVVSSQNPEAS
jgi:hypothetical protein